MARMVDPVDDLQFFDMTREDLDIAEARQSHGWIPQIMLFEFEESFATNFVIRERLS